MHSISHFFNLWGKLIIFFSVQASWFHLGFLAIYMCVNLCFHEGRTGGGGGDSGTVHEPQK